MQPRSDVGRDTPGTHVLIADVPGLKTAYRNLRPMLFGALGKLSRKSFPVLPSNRSITSQHNILAAARRPPRKPLVCPDYSPPCATRGYSVLVD